MRVAGGTLSSRGTDKLSKNLTGMRMEGRERKVMRIQYRHADTQQHTGREGNEEKNDLDRKIDMQKLAG